MGDQTSDEATLRRLRQMGTYQQFRCSQKFAVDAFLDGNSIYLMHNSGSRLWWLNVVLIDEFLDNRDDPLQLIAGFHTFFESSKMFEFVPWMILTSNPDVVDVFKNLRKSGEPDKPLMKIIDSTAMILDLDTDPNAYKAPQLPESHTYNQLTIKKVEEKDGEPATDFVKVEFDAFGVPVVEGLIDEAVDVYDRRRWKVGQPVIESFVGYEGNTPVATGTVVMRKEDQVATIVEIGCAHGFRGKGYGARIFSKCVQTAIDAGFKSMVLISSEEGVDLYARQGFKRIGGGSVSMITLA